MEKELWETESSARRRQTPDDGTRQTTEDARRRHEVNDGAFDFKLRLLYPVLAPSTAPRAAATTTITCILMQRRNACRLFRILYILHSDDDGAFCSQTAFFLCTLARSVGARDGKVA